MANKTFSTNLKMCRKNCGLTQQQVADCLNINRTTYTYYETGKTEPSINMIVKICKILGVSYEVLFPALDTTVIYSNEKMFSLSKQEQELIGKFRLKSEETKAKLISLFSAIV